jgi:hypothetical protein
MGEDQILGTASDGGANFGGAIFQLIPPTTEVPGTLIDLYDFGKAPAASGPIGKLISGSSGALYGITETGGTGDCGGGAGCGTVFEAGP